MAYNILGINPGHNGSISLISDGKLLYYLEEERFSKLKRDANPYKAIIEICSKYEIHEIICSGMNFPQESIQIPWTLENPFYALIRKFQKTTPKFTLSNKHHHLHHASSSFYSSGFDKAITIVVDGGGSLTTFKKDKIKIKAFEIESIYVSEYPAKHHILYKRFAATKKYSNSRIIIDECYEIKDSLGIGKIYESITCWLGFNPLDGGKTMGLASYGKYNSNIPPLVKDERGNRDLFIPEYPLQGEIDVISYPLFNLKSSKIKEFHKDSLKFDPLYADIAFHAQKETQELLAKFIKTSIDKTGIKKVCIGGGYALNCVSNYFLKKTFPDVEFFIDPLSYDGGTSLGAAKLEWYSKSNDTSIYPQKSYYLGIPQELSQVKNQIKKYYNMFNPYKITPEQVAKLISERNIVTIFQGRSEAGPRALGNRSILYDPTDPNGKDFVNKVKKREWFRPFAGTVLLEKANEWFDMAGLEESPFMMYAMDVWPDKQEQIQAITHVDGTCRIQTVTEEQNSHYYKLIQEFEKITGVPILFNTSFNLAGDPLVETIEDALETMLKSEMKYMYVPELEMLLEKK